MKKQSIKITDIALLLLFSVFALCLLLLLLTGAEIYRDINSMAEQAHSRRTADRYISTRVRQADSAERLSIESFDGCQALCISEDIDGQSYLTRIYCFDGGIRELFSEADYRRRKGSRISQIDLIYRNIRQSSVRNNGAVPCLRRFQL